MAAKKANGNLEGGVLMTWDEFLRGPELWGQLTWLGLGLAYLGIAWCVYAIGRLQDRVDKVLSTDPNVDAPNDKHPDHKNHCQNEQEKYAPPGASDAVTHADSPLEKSPDRMSNRNNLVQ